MDDCQPKSVNWKKRIPPPVRQDKQWNSSNVIIIWLGDGQKAFLWYHSYIPMVINFHSSIFYEIVSIQSGGKLCKEEPASPSNTPLSIHGPTFPLTPFSPFFYDGYPSSLSTILGPFFVASQPIFSSRRHKKVRREDRGKGKEGARGGNHSLSWRDRKGGKERRRDDDDDAWKKGKWKRDSSPPYPGKGKSPHGKRFFQRLARQKHLCALFSVAAKRYIFLPWIQWDRKHRWHGFAKKALRHFPPPIPANGSGKQAMWLSRCLFLPPYTPPTPPIPLLHPSSSFSPRVIIANSLSPPPQQYVRKRNVCVEKNKGGEEGLLPHKPDMTLAENLANYSNFSAR